MNWFDIILLIIIAASVAASFRKGISREVIGIVTVIVALLAATWGYSMAGGYLRPYVSSRAIANFGGFALVFLAVMILGGIAGALAGKVLRFSGLSFIDHLLGALFGAVRGILVSVALVMAVMAFSPSGHPPAAVVRSRLSPYVIEASRVFAAMAPFELKEGFRKTYEQVKAAWGNAVKHGLPGAPGTEKANKNEREI